LNLEELKDYFRKRVDGFQGGCLRHSVKIWEYYTSDPEVLNTITGLSIEFLAESSPLIGKRPYPQSQNMNDIITGEINKLLEKGVIVDSEAESEEVISPIFLREKSDGTHRMILNLKELNKTVEFYHFKMETIHSVIKLIRQNDFMIKIDIKDAYYSIPIALRDQKFFKFEHLGKLYKYTALPNGFSPGPRKFTKAVKVPLSVLRKERITIAAYIDDLISINGHKGKCLKNVYRITELFDQLGFVIHPDKSEFLPKQEIEYLGFIINSVNMTITLTPKKKSDLYALAVEIYNSEQIKIRKLAKLLGKISSSFPATKFGKLFFRALERDKIKALRSVFGNYESKMTLTDQAKTDIKWWIDNVHTAFASLRNTNPTLTLTTDASKKGWGRFSRDTQPMGFSFKKSQKSTSIS